MYPQTDEIVPIPPNRVKYFGTTGRMLLPSPATLATLIGRVPVKYLATTDLLRQHLTDEFDVEGTCPITTQKSLQAVAHDLGSVAYWRVINQNGGLIKRFPGGFDGHAARLRDEGFIIDTQGKSPTVKGFKASLVRF
jgi:hypothetical protein